MSPLFWIFAVLATVLACTGHLCLGLWLGRSFSTDRERALQRTRASLAAGAGQVGSQRARVAELSGVARDLERSCAAPNGLDSDEVTQNVARLRKLVAQLTKDVDASAARYRDLLEYVIREVERKRDPQAAYGAALAANLPLAEPRQTGVTPATPRAPAAPPQPEPFSTESAWPGGRFDRRDANVSAAQTNLNRTPGEPASGEPASARWPAEPPDDESDPDAWMGLTSEEVDAMRTGAADKSSHTRRDVRYPYRAQQFIAPVHGTVFPSPDDFRLVKCRDIARRGISFFDVREPTTEDLIISLGNRPDLHFHKLHIQSVRRSWLDGAEGFTVGCRFDGRVDKSVYQWDAASERVIAAAPDPATLETLTAE